jgi:peroxiredoxin
MRGRLKFLGILAVVVLVAVAFVSIREGKGYHAPGFRLPSLAGGTVDVRSFPGRIVIVNFWATWCPPCVEELPSLERLHRTLSPEGVVVLGVSVDEDEAVLRQFVEQHRPTFAILRDPGGTVAHGYGSVQWPETYVLDGAGVVRSEFIGPQQWDTPEMLDYFRGLLRSLRTSPTR